MKSSNPVHVAQVGSAAQNVTPAAAPMNPIVRKVERILQSKIETDPDMIIALESISDIVPDNTAANRRNLRKNIESKTVQTNLDFLASFKIMKDHLELVAADVGAMDTCCQAMSDRLRMTKEQTTDLINQTTKLQSDSNRVEKRAIVVQAFLDTFTLSPDHRRILITDKDQPIRADFFPALQRVRQIHTDCKQLLTHQHSVAALQVVESMAAQLESSYERLYRWIQRWSNASQLRQRCQLTFSSNQHSYCICHPRECRLLNVDMYEVSSVLSMAFHAIHERPVLFKYSLDEFATARRNNLVRCFIDALTRGGGSSKPIELLSHDPQRYVSDMLACIHQAIASEKDILHSLLKACDQQVIDEQTCVVLTQITDGLCRPFKIRVEQCLSAENGPVVLYRLCNLFAFYGDTIRSNLNEESALLGSMLELQELTDKLFASSLSNNVQRLCNAMAPPSEQLGVDSRVHQLLLLLRDVLQSHDHAMANMPQQKQINFQTVFCCVLDPLQKNVLLTCAHVNAVQSAVYIMNCYSAVHALLCLYPYTDERLEMLTAQMDAQQDVLVSEQVGVLLHRAGLYHIYTTAQHHTPDTMGPLSSLPDLDTSCLKTWLEKFDLVLAKPDGYLLPETQLVTSLKLRQAVRTRTMGLLCSVYETIINQLVDPKNAFGQLEYKSVDQVKQLLL